MMAAAALRPTAAATPMGHVQASRERSLTAMIGLSGWRRFVPEAIALTALIWFALSWSTGDPVAHGNMPHPFWIPVLLMSAQYGIMGGLFAALVVTGTYFVTSLPMQSAAEDFYAYATVVAAQPCAWFATALILGALRTLHIHHQSELRDQLEQSQLVAGDLAGGLQQAVEEIDRLEERIAGDDGSLTAFAHSLGKVQAGDRKTLLVSFSDVIRFGAGATSFAIYLKDTRWKPLLAIEDGVRAVPDAVPSLSSLLPGLGRAEPRNELQMRDCFGPEGNLLWAWIKSGEAAEPLGIVVCTRLAASRDIVSSQVRLQALCRVLALLISACPKSDPGE